MNIIKSLIRKLNSYRIFFLGNKVNCRGAIIGNNCTFEGFNKINKNSVLSNVKIGKGTYIGYNCEFYNCTIGKFCSISNDIKIVFGRHPSSKFVSTHPAFFSTMKQAGFTYVTQNIYEENKRLDNGSSVKIGNDVWVGQGVRIMEGINIGDGAIIGSYALITKDVESYSVVGGIPAKHIKYRFSKEQIEFLKGLKWWDKSDEWISCNSHYFNNIDQFMNLYKIKG